MRELLHEELQFEGFVGGVELREKFLVEDEAVSRIKLFQFHDVREEECGR